jgi:hypothetical protein
MDLELMSKRELAKLTTSLSEKSLASAVKRAGISAARKMRTEAARKVREHKALPLSYVLKKVVLKSQAGGSMGTMGWMITVNGSPIPISEFKMRQTKKGVKFKANRSGWSMFDGAFVATVGKGHRGAFTRANKGTSARKKYRGKDGKWNNSQLPIKQLYTSGLGASFKDAQSRNDVYQAGDEVFTKTFVRIIKSKM